MSTLEISDALAEQLTQAASARGGTVEEYLRTLIPVPRPPQLTPEERARRWREWAARQEITAPPLSDEAISRESIYTREDERAFLPPL